jgi:hypothetical protein
MRTIFATFVVGLTVAAMLPSALPEGPHDYFQRLIGRPDVFTVNGVRRAFSLRPVPGAQITSAYYENQLNSRGAGGYRSTNTCYGSPDIARVTYSPQTDSNAHRQDAAKVVIPQWCYDTTSLAAAINSTQNWIPLALMETWPRQGRSIRIDNEVMTIERACPTCSHLDGNSIYVIRGTFNTTAVSHGAGAGIDYSTNSLSTQLRLPVKTPSGSNSTYLFTWDIYYTDSFLNAGTYNTALNAHKTFQFGSGNDGFPGEIWVEPRIHFDAGHSCCPAPGFNPNIHVGGVDVRAYNQPGPGPADWTASDGNTLGPNTTRDPLRHITSPAMDGYFLVTPNRWTRFWVRLEVRVNDYDYFTMWVADEATNAVKLLDNMPVSLQVTNATTPNSVEAFWLELNSSVDSITRPDFHDWVAYFRNVVILKDPVDIPNLLVRPVGGEAGPIITDVIAPPGQLRIIR